MNLQVNFYPKGLWNTGWRYLILHRWQTILMVLGIALGVAVMVAIDIANASAGRAFELSTEALTGKTTHQIFGGVGGVEERVYVDLRSQGWGLTIAPVISEFVSSPQLGNRALQLLGIDPLVDGSFRKYTNDLPAENVANLVSFLTKPGAVYISKGQSLLYGISPGDEISLEVQGITRKAFIAGVLDATDDLTQRTLDGLIIVDISTAQEFTGRLKRLDRIDLILPADVSDLQERIKTWLPSGLRLTLVEESKGAIEEMTAAFRVNLSALSMLALVVGLFLIYNTMTFSVVQRRTMFGTLRCLGVTKKEVFGLVLGEAFLVGLLGTAVGIAFGVMMGRTTIGLVTQTINDLYFTTTIQEVGIPIESLVKGGLIGLAATMITASFPAWEAASVPPKAALSRSGLETKAQKAVILVTILGLILIAAGLLAFNLPGNALLFGFGGTFAIVVGFALLSVIAMVAILKFLRPFLGKTIGFLGKMAPRNLVNSLSRTSMAISALMVAVAVSVGVTIMIDSFRYTVTVWLDETLQGDIYVTAPGFTATVATTLIDPQTVSLLKTWPGASSVDTLRTVSVDSPQGFIQLSATNNTRFGVERKYSQINISPEKVWGEMLAGGVLISEPLANRLQTSGNNQLVELFTPSGPINFPIIGVFFDYSSSEGILFMAMDTYQKFWSDNGVTAIALRLNPDQVINQVTNQLQTSLPNNQRLLIRPNQVLRSNIMEVFDRTFAITAALRFLATIVAFIGVMNSLLLLQLDKQREAGILRAIGLSRHQLWWLTMLETGLMGLIAGMLAIPTGYVLSLILVEVINRRSFGWTLQLSLTPEVFLEALIIAVSAAILAGILPAWRIGRKLTIEVMRND